MFPPYSCNDQAISIKLHQKTWAETVTAGYQFGVQHKVHTYAKGDIGLIQDDESQAVLGFFVLGEFPNGNVYRERLLIDPSIYTGRDDKFNKFELCVKKYHVFPQPLPFVRFAVYLGGIDPKIPNNIVKRNHMTMRRLFYKSPEEDTVIQRIREFLSLFPQS